VSGLSTSLRRDRSHEPDVRHRLAGSHSKAGRQLRTRIASYDSCSFTNQCSREGATDTPESSKCQQEGRIKIAIVNEIVGPLPNTGAMS
jgi:hypothetical protein